MMRNNMPLRSVMMLAASTLFEIFMFYVNLIAIAQLGTARGFCRDVERFNDISWVRQGLAYSFSPSFDCDKITERAVLLLIVALLYWMARVFRRAMGWFVWYGRQGHWA